MASQRVMHRPLARGLGASLGLVTIGAAGMLACDTSARVDAVATADSLPFGYVQECPRDWKRVYAPDRQKPPGPTAVATAPPDGIAGVGRITDVPEFHDCQRLLLTNGTYGPLVAVFAAWELDSLDIRAAAAAGLPVRQRPDSAKLDSGVRTPQPGLAGGRGRAGAPTPTPIPAQPVARGGRSAETAGAQPPARGQATANAIGLLGGVILNLGQRYRVDNFVIEHGYSCLYLWLAPDWQARIVPVKSDSVCLQPLDPKAVSTTAGNLKVLEDWGAGGDRADYPAVARWDYDPESRQQYIGIKCGAAWCEVGSSSFRPSARYVYPSSSPDLRKVRRIKGWYDEQALAVAQADTSLPLVPSSLKGTLIPHPRLDSYTDVHFNRRWAPVAYVALDGRDSAHLAYYKKKANLEQAPVARDTGQLNKVELCHGTVEQCRVVTDTTTGTCSAAANSGSTVPWWARITAANSRTVTYSCVIREDHTGMNHHIPGTARWRWVLKDETKWARCVQGCCEVDNNAT